MLKQTDVQTLLTAECANIGVFVAKSRIKHQEVGIGLAAAKTFRRVSRALLRIDSVP